MLRFWRFFPRLAHSFIISWNLSELNISMNVHDIATELLESYFSVLNHLYFAQELTWFPKCNSVIPSAGDIWYNSRIQSINERQRIQMELHWNMIYIQIIHSNTLEYYSKIAWYGTLSLSDYMYNLLRDDCCIIYFFIYFRLYFHLIRLILIIK